jgi:hypothetical protein
MLMSTINLTKSCRRIALMTLAASVVMLCSQCVLAALQTGESDSMMVYITFQGLPTANPRTVTIPEDGSELDRQGNGLFVGNPAPLRPGYVLIFEPDGTTVSDVVKSTGSTISLFSDPSLPTMSDLAGLPNLSPASPLIEDPQKGINVDVGPYFSLPQILFPGPFQIQVQSDGDVPEPSSLVVWSLLGLGVCAARWWRRKR